MLWGSSRCTWWNGRESWWPSTISSRTRWSWRTRIWERSGDGTWRWTLTFHLQLNCLLLTSGERSAFVSWGRWRRCRPAREFSREWTSKSKRPSPPSQWLDIVEIIFIRGCGDSDSDSETEIFSDTCADYIIRRGSILVTETDLIWKTILLWRLDSDNYILSSLTLSDVHVSK